MQIKTFLISFENSLIANGFSPESARRHTLKIAKSLKETDKNKIHAMENGDDVVKMADNYSARIKALSAREHVVENSQDTATVSTEFRGSVADHESGRSPVKTAVKEETVEDVNELDDPDEIIINKKNSKKQSKKEKEKDKDESKKVTKTAHAVTQKVDAVKKNKKVELTETGKKNYRKWLMSKGVGVLAGLIFAYIGVFFVYALIALLISLLVAFLVIIAAIGCIGTLAGLIYGVITLFSVVPEGIYEIGLALVIMAVTLALSIAVYNLAVRVVPILWKRFSQFLKEKRTDLRNKLNDIRTECNAK